MLPNPGIPDDWSPEQALAVYEFLDALRERVRDHYREQIQQQYRSERVTLFDPPSDLFEPDDDLPF